MNMIATEVIFKSIFDFDFDSIDPISLFIAKNMKPILEVSMRIFCAYFYRHAALLMITGMDSNITVQYVQDTTSYKLRAVELYSIMRGI